MAEETREYVPIYYDSPEKAYRESVTSPEADAFRASFNATEKCAGDIQAALSQNRESAGKFSSTDFIDGLLDRHGKERVEYVLASYIRSRENESPYFSDEVKSWAHGIRISDSYMIANTIIVAGGDDMVNALAENLRGRDLAAEYVEAKEGGLSATAGEDFESEVSGETPATGATNVETSEDAEASPESENVTRNDDGSITVKMPEDAVIRRYQTSAVLCMPRNRGYDMYRYMVDIKYFRENGDGTVDVTLGTNEAHTLTIRRRGQEQKLSADKLLGVFAGATKGDYVPKKYTVEVPTHAVQGNYPNMIRCKFPDSSRYSGQHVVVPSIFKNEAKSDDEKIVFSVPDYINFSVRDEDGNDMLIPVSDVAREVNGGTYRKRVCWARAILPGEAMLHVYEKHTLMKMPESGVYRGFVYYLPNGMVTQDKDGSIIVRVPDDRKIEVKNGMTGEKDELSVVDWMKYTNGKNSNDFLIKRDSAYPGEKEFMDAAEKVRSVMPPEMLAEKSWIPVRIKESALGGDGDRPRHNMFAVSPEKKFSSLEAGYKNIGTDFDKAVRAGRNYGATLMGFCFSKDNDVVCLELDRCLDKDGTPKTEKAKEILENLDGTYMERSVSGEGLHILGKLSDPKIEALSKDGEVEMFSSCGYVVLTGDVVKSPKCLAPLDEGYMKKFIEHNFDEAKEIPTPTEKDKEVLDKVFNASVKGKDYEELYNGETRLGGKEHGDMELASRIAFVTMGDTRTVMRLYNSSKREGKDPELISHIAKRATDSAMDLLRTLQKSHNEDESVHAARVPEKLKWREERNRREKNSDGPTM